MLKLFDRYTKVRKYLLLIFVFCAGFGICWAYLVSASNQLSRGVEEGLRQAGKYQYTSPLLTCTSYESTNLKDYTLLKNRIEDVIAAKKQAGEAMDVSVYYRDFRGVWMGINENEQYAPASLLKVPLMIAYYKEAESAPQILQKVLVYDGSYDDNASETFKSSLDIKPGSYTVNELLTAMIVNSDNNATRVLVANIDRDVLRNVYTDLGISISPESGFEASALSVKQYSYFFRILYNSTYLSPFYSEKALELLIAPDFPQGIEATMPAGVPVAQKFGERSVFTPKGELVERQLHDCGIVYNPRGQYLLCIMTRGNDFNGLIDVIQSISKTVYQTQ